MLLQALSVVWTNMNQHLSAIMFIISTHNILFMSIHVILTQVCVCILIGAWLLALINFRLKMPETQKGAHCSNQLSKPSKLTATCSKDAILWYVTVVKTLATPSLHWWHQRLFILRTTILCSITKYCYFILHTTYRVHSMNNLWWHHRQTDLSC